MDEVLKLLTEGNLIKEKWEAMNEKEKLSVFTGPADSVFVKNLNDYFEKIGKFSASYNACLTFESPVNVDVTQAFIGVLNLRKELEKNIGELIGNNNGEIGKNLEKKTKDCYNVTNELFSTVQNRKNFIEIKLKVLNEKNLEILRKDANSKKIINLIGKNLDRVLIANNSTEFKILSYLIDKQGQEIDNVDLFKSATGLNCSEDIIKAFIGRFGNNQISDIICNVNVFRSNIGTISDADIIRCMEKFVEDESFKSLNQVLDAMKIEKRIEEDVNINLTINQTNVLLSRLGSYENIVKQINDLKVKFGADDEMIKTSIEIFARSSIATLEEAYETAKTYQKNEQESEEFTEKLNALRPQGNMPSGRSTRGRRTQFQNVSHDRKFQEPQKPQEPESELLKKYRRFREQQAYDGWGN